MLERIEVERINIGGRMISTADVCTGEDTRCLSFMEQMIDDFGMMRGLGG